MKQSDWAPLTALIVNNLFVWLPDRNESAYQLLSQWKGSRLYYSKIQIILEYYQTYVCSNQTNLETSSYDIPLGPLRG